MSKGMDMGKGMYMCKGMKIGVECHTKSNTCLVSDMLDKANKK